MKKTEYVNIRLDPVTMEEFSEAIDKSDSQSKESITKSSVIRNAIDSFISKTKKKYSK